MSAWGGVPAKPAAEDNGFNAMEDDFPSMVPVVKVKANDDDLDMYAGMGGGKKGKKKNKKENTKMSLADFAAKTGDDGGLQALPSRPRERDPNEEEEVKGPKLGGAFKDYGGDRGDRGDRGGYGGRDRRDGDERRERQPRRGQEDDGEPSRADGDWSKKPVAAPGPPRRDDRYNDRGESRGDRDREERGPSRADENSNWGASKKFVPSDDRDGPRRERNDDRNNRGMGDGRPREEDRDWKKKEIPPPRTPEPAGERPRLQLQKRTIPVEEATPKTLAEGAQASEESKSKSKPSPFGSAAPVQTRDVEGESRDRRESIEGDGGAPPPRRNGAPAERPSDRDWNTARKERAEQSRGAEAAGSKEEGPSGGDRKEEGQQQQQQRPKLVLQKRTVEDAPAAPVAAETGAKLFGGARPRELALEEKGRDWRKEEMELARKGIQRPESEEEKKLKAEVEALRAKVEQAEEDKELASQLAAKEAELAKLTFELDDKVRFAKEAAEPRKDKEGGGGGKGAGGAKREGRQGGDSGARRENKEVAPPPTPPASAPSPKPAKIISEDGFEEVTRGRRKK